MRTATSWAPGIASGSTPPASEHARSVPATGNRCDVAVGAERIALIHAARIPEYPRPDAQLFGRADLLADFVRGVTRLAAPECERLEEGTDRRRFHERPRALDGFAQRVPDHTIGFAVGPRESVAPPVVMARVHHRQHDVGDADEILPYLADAEIARGRRGETEDVERDRHAERLDAVGENRDARL